MPKMGSRRAREMSMKRKKKEKEGKRRRRMGKEDRKKGNRSLGKRK